MKKLWMLLASETLNPRGLPPAWPVQYSYEKQPAPWIETDVDGLELQEANNQAAYDAWRAANPPAKEPASDILGEVQSPNGLRWIVTVDDTGKLVVTPA